MKRSLLLAGAAVVALAGGIALAQPAAFGIAPAAAQERGDGARADRDHRGHHGWHRGGPRFDRVCGPERAERLEDMLAVAERRLAITAAQRTSWTNLTAALRDASTKVGATCDSLKAGRDDTSAPARLARMETVTQTGTAVIQAVRPSFDAFYAGLSAEQKTKLDRLMSRHRG
ncbi:MAG: Spy/CpxP family protein refolding chaperone [Rhodospirillales bacterium]